MGTCCDEYHYVSELVGHYDLQRNEGNYFNTEWSGDCWFDSHYPDPSDLVCIDCLLVINISFVIIILLLLFIYINI